MSVQNNHKNQSINPQIIHKATLKIHLTTFHNQVKIFFISQVNTQAIKSKIPPRMLDTHSKIVSQCFKNQFRNCIIF